MKGQCIVLKRRVTLCCAVLDTMFVVGRRLWEWLGDIDNDGNSQQRHNLQHAQTTPHNKLRRSDDADDSYTEQGRQLIRREGEALASGLRVGEVLAAGDLELQLPGLKGLAGRNSALL